MDITIGTLVEHSAWGRGKVLTHDHPYVEVHFLSLQSSPHGPLKKLRTNAPQLSVSPVQDDPSFANIAVPVPTRVRVPKHKRLQPVVNSIEQSIDWFRRKYPELFTDPALIIHELQYKREAHAGYVQRFGRGRAVLERGDLTQIAKDLRWVYHATNIPSRFEQMAAGDGLKDTAMAGRLLERLLAFLESPGADSFEHFVDAVAALPAPAKGSRVLSWPNVTILPFLADPSRFMVMKPAVSKRMAKRLNLDLRYSPAPKWHAYEALLEMSTSLLARLRPLGATDFIDVQSFMWVTRDLE